MVAQRRSEGRVFVLKDPASADLETQFLAGLVGGVMVTQQFAETKGYNGAAIAYQPALASKRSVFITSKFMAQHPSLCHDMCDIFQLELCKWQLLRDGQLQNYLGRLNATRARQLVILKAGDEDESFNPAKLVLTLSQAVESPVVCRVDKSRSRTGICPTY